MMKRSLPVLAALCLALPAAADNAPANHEQVQSSPGHTTYHIDPVNGDDANSGLAREQAWRGFHGVKRLRLAAGDRVEIVGPGRNSIRKPVASTAARIPW